MSRRRGRLPAPRHFPHGGLSQYTPTSGRHPLGEEALCGVSSSSTLFVQPAQSSIEARWPSSAHSPSSPPSLRTSCPNASHSFARWRGRFIAVSGPATSLVGNTLSNTGYCLSPEDLCVAKLCANRDKDREFVGALLDTEIVDPYDVMNFLDPLNIQHEEADAPAQSFLHHWKNQ